MAQCDLGLEALLKRVQAADKSVRGGAIMRRALGQLASKASDRAKLLTPVDTGRLRGAWRGSVNLAGLEAVISNSVDYAAAVNYGHRQTPGRFVPAIGVRLKASYVPGREMLGRALREAEAKDLPVAKKQIMDGLRRELGM